MRGAKRPMKIIFGETWWMIMSFWLKKSKPKKFWTDKAEHDLAKYVSDTHARIEARIRLQSLLSGCAFGFGVTLGVLLLFSHEWRRSGASKIASKSPSAVAVQCTFILAGHISYGLSVHPWFGLHCCPPSRAQLFHERIFCGFSHRPRKYSKFR